MTTHSYRSALIVSACLTLLTSSSFAQKKRYSNDPIAVVKLDRKDPVTYEKDVYPILKAKCMFCHSGNVVEGEFDMGTFAGLLKGGKRGKTLVAGKADESLLYLSAGKMKSPRMPPRREKPLTPQELALIKLWIDQGAKAPEKDPGMTKVIVSLPPATVQPVRAVAVSPDKKFLVASKGNQLHVYEPIKGEHLRKLVDPSVKTPDGQPVDAAHLTLVESLAYSPDGKVVVSGSFQEVKFWDAATGKLIRKIEGFADRVVTLSFSPDSKKLATGGGPPTLDGEIKIFNVADGKEILNIKEGHSDQVFGVSFSPDGKVLATCGADKFVKTWDANTGKFIKSLEGHTHHVMDVDWRSDGKTLASAGADNAIKVWDYEKGEQKRTVNGHSKQVTRLEFVGKTAEFVTCSGDKTVRMWNADNGRTRRNFGGAADFLYALTVSPDGKLVAAGGESGIVRVWDGSNGRALKTLQPPSPETAKK